MPVEVAVPGGKLAVLLLIRSLDVGGTQRQLILLAKGLKERGHSVRVACFYGGGALASELRENGIELVDLGKKGRWDVLAFMNSLVREVRRSRPDVVYSFLGGANIVAAMARPFVRRTRLVWGIRASNVDLAQYDWLHRFAYKVERSLSRFADLIIANSPQGAAHAIDNGFAKQKVVVVPNGIDTDRFRPDPKLRRFERQSFGLGDDQIAIGVLARLDVMKGHESFLRAARIASSRASNLAFLCIGDGPELARIEHVTEELGLGGRVTFTGERDPVAALNALDIACSCSLWGEGFSNSIAEAMACGLQCVVTDVGSSAEIVGSTGAVVPPGSPEALAKAFLAAAASPESYDQSRPRERIVANFSASAMVDRTLTALTNLTTGSVRAP